MEYLVGFLSGVAAAFVALDFVSRVRAGRTRDRMTAQHVEDLNAEFRDWAARRRAANRLSSGRLA